MNPRLRLSIDQVLAFRIVRQFLEAPADGALEVVRGLAGIQAQVPSAAEAAVAVRTSDASASPLGPLLADGRAIRTWAMRGTLHVLASDDAPAYLALMAATRSWERPVWQRSFINASQLAKLRTIVAEELAAGPRTRDELVAAIAARSGDPGLVEQLRSGWGTVLKPLAWMGELCHGPADGPRVVFTRPADLASGWPPLPTAEEAARVVIGRFLAAYGPASEDDFLAWLSRGATRRSDLRRWLAALGDEVVEIEVDGSRALALARDLEAMAASRPGGILRLLPAFDPYVLGAGTANPWVIDPPRRAAVSRAGGWISPVVLLDGRVVGVWSVADGVTVQLFAERAGSVSRAVLDAEVERVAPGLAVSVETV